MKPDWKDAPSWANHLAMDEDGAWWWFGDKPEKSDGYWSFEQEFDEQGWTVETKVQSAIFENWRDTLEQRPK